MGHWLLILLTSINISGNLTDYQKQIVNAPVRFTVTEAGTKTGKTYSHLYWLFKKSIEVPDGYVHNEDEPHHQDGRNYWWVAPIYSQSKIAYLRLDRKVGRLPGFKCNASDLTITTPFGSIITFKTAKDPNNLYGEDVYAAVFDEFTRAKEAAWFALRSTLTATNGKCKFIGNFTGNSNWGHQLGLKAKTDKRYQYFKITAYDAVNEGILKAEEIEEARNDLPPWMFKALYLAEGDIDQTRLMSDDDINDMFTNSYVADGQKYMTCDIAFQGSDKFVVFIWSGFKIIAKHIIDKCDGPEIEKAIKGLAVKYKVPRSHIVYDADGVGTFLKGYLKGARSFHNGATPIEEKGHKMEYKNLKSQCYFKLAAKVSDGGIYIECELGKAKDLLIEDLEQVKNRSFGTDGKLEVLRKKEVKEYIGRSPDYSDSVMMRFIFELNKPKRVKTTTFKFRGE